MPLNQPCTCQLNRIRSFLTLTSLSQQVIAQRSEAHSMSVVKKSLPIIAAVNDP